MTMDESTFNINLDLITNRLKHHRTMIVILITLFQKLGMIVQTSVPTSKFSYSQISRG